jgi:DNA-binding response OmpR family regulator
MNRILVVDDEENILFLLQAALQNSYEVLEAADGQAAFKLYQAHQPDLIITDMSMPIMSGLELIHEIRKTDQQVKIIATSALFYNPEEARAVMKMGVDACLTKPVALNIMEETIRQLLDNPSR